MKQLHHIVFAILLTLTINKICKGQPILKFTEEDYTSEINSDHVQVQITKSGISNGDIIIGISPLTFDASTSECSTLASRFVNYNRAEDDDFDSTQLMKTISSSDTGESNTYSFDVPLILDNVLEADEAFVIILNIINANEVVYKSRACCIVTIREPPFNGTLVNFKRDQATLSPDSNKDIELSEDTGSEILLTISKAIESEIPLRVTVISLPIDYTSEGSDFKVPIKSIDITKDELSIDILIEIIDDDIAEDTEILTLTVQVSPVGNPFSTQITLQIKILDDEVVTLGIKNSEEIITVTEGESAIVIYGLVNFEVQNYQRFSVALVISTVDETAMEEQDYKKLETIYRPFLSDNNTANIETIKQVGIEPQRKFTFEFISEPPALTVFDRQQITIIITDSSILTNSSTKQNNGEGVKIENTNSFTTSEIPLAPTITTLTEEESMMETIWTYETNEDHPVDSFIVIIKACSSTPCEIKDPDVLKADETLYPVSNSMLHLLADVDSSKTHAVVVCAVSSLGRSCSVPIINKKDPVIPLDPNPIQGLQTTTSPSTAKSPPIVAIGVVVLCVLLTILFFIIIIVIINLVKRDREKAYWPQKSTGNELEGKSVDPGLEEDDIFEMKYF